MKDCKLLYIKWADAVGDPENGWKDPKSTEEFFERTDNVCHEVGFLFKETKDYICLISWYMPGDVTLTHHRMMIPKRWVLERRELDISTGAEVKQRVQKLGNIELKNMQNPD